jgi:hypothetical protein
MFQNADGAILFDLELDLDGRQRRDQLVLVRGRYRAVEL